MRRLPTLILMTGLATSSAAHGDPALPRANPADVGMSAERLERVDAALERFIENGDLAGVDLAIVRHGRLVYRGSGGWADREAGKPVAENGIYRIYSMTKPVTAVAAMTLIEEGRLRLTDKLADYLPAFADMTVMVGGTPDVPELAPAERAITIRDLFLHTSGLTYDDYPDRPVSEIYRRENMFDYDAPLATLADKAARLPMARQPGERFEYGISMDVLARVIEIVSGQSYDVFLRERVTGPLGMTDTAFIVPPEKRDRLAVVYRQDKDGRLLRQEDAETAAGTTRWGAGAKLFSGGGGLTSTMRDYLRFCQMLLNGGELEGTRILSRKSVELMMTDHLGDTWPGLLRHLAPGYGFGLGGAVQLDTAKTGAAGSEGEYFWGGAASTSFFIDPKEDLAVVFMTQLQPYEVDLLHTQLKAIVYQALDD